MTSKLVVNTIEADTGISSVSFASSISMSSTSKFHFGAAGIDIGADTNINRPAAGVLGFNINSSEKVRIDSNGKVGIATDTGSGLINTRHAGTNQQVLHVRADLGSNNGRVLNIYTPDTDNTTAPFRFQTGNGYLFQCDTEDVFTIAHDRKIGIGTNAPSAKLEVQDRSGGTLIGLSVGTQYGNASFGGYNNYPAIMNSSSQPLIYCDTNNDRTEFFGDTVGFGTTCAFRVNSVERLRIDSSGDIGLGESNPNRSGYSSPVTSVGYNSSNGYGVLELLGNQTSDNTIANIVAYNIGGSSRLGAIAFERSGANNSGAIRFETYTSGSSSERMRISKEGYVTKPAHPSFCARHNSGDGFDGDIIVLTRMGNPSWDVWNTGGHYSTSTGKFTAPVTGVYYFEGQLMTTGHSNGDNIQDMLSLMSNNGRISYCRQRKSYFRSDEDANGYYTNSVGGSTRLSSGDTVWIQRHSSQNWSYSNRYYSYFTGWLIG